MAWCVQCDRFLNPSTVTTIGTCPTCGEPVETPESANHPVDAAFTNVEQEIPRAPWHFKIAVGAVAIYLGFRALEGVIWLVGRF